MNLNNEQRLNLLVSAIEGGSNYWYFFEEKACLLIHKYGQDEIVSFAEKLLMAINAGEKLLIHDVETNEEIGMLSLENINKGEAIMLRHYPVHFANVISETDDAETGDVWLQLCSLGELIYA